MMDFTAQLRIGLRIEPSDIDAERKNQMELLLLLMMMMMMMAAADGCRIYRDDASSRLKLSSFSIRFHNEPPQDIKMTSNYCEVKFWRTFSPTLTRRMSLFLFVWSSSSLTTS